LGIGPHSSSFFFFLPFSSPNLSSPQFSAHVYCGQTAAWIKMPLGMEVGLGQGHIVLDGNPAPPPRKGGTATPIFGRCLLWSYGWMYQDATWYFGRPQPGQHCVRCGPSSTPRAQPPNFGRCLLCPNGWMDQDGTVYEGRPQPWPHSVTWGPSSITPPKRGTAPNFRPMSIVVKRSPISATAEHLLNSSWLRVPYFIMGRPFPPQNCRFAWGDLDSHLIHGNGFLGPPECTTQTASQSV